MDSFISITEVAVRLFSEHAVGSLIFPTYFNRRQAQPCFAIKLAPLGDGRPPAMLVLGGNLFGIEDGDVEPGAILLQETIHRELHPAFESPMLGTLAGARVEVDPTSEASTSDFQDTRGVGLAGCLVVDHTSIQIVATLAESQTSSRYLINPLTWGRGALSNGGLLTFRQWRVSVRSSETQDRFHHFEVHARRQSATAPPPRP